MSGNTTASFFRSLLPSEPAKWFWTRLKLYLAVLVAAVVGFFFVAGWYAAPTGDHEGRLLPLTSLVAMLIQIVAILISGWVARHEMHELNHESQHAAESNKPPGS